MDRRGFFKIFGKVGAVAAAAKIAPELLVTETKAALPSVPGVQGYPQGIQGFQGMQGVTGICGFTCAGGDFQG